MFSSGKEQGKPTSRKGSPSDEFLPDRACTCIAGPDTTSFQRRVALISVRTTIKEWRNLRQLVQR